MWAALDAEFYLALDAGEDGCVSLVSELRCNLLLLPSAYQEIADHCLTTEDAELRAAALNALRFMATYQIIAAPAPNHNLGKDETLAEDLVGEGVISREDYDSALILGEAACADVDYLLTLDPVILNVDKGVLEAAIANRHLHPFEIVCA